MALLKIFLALRSIFFHVNNVVTAISENDIVTFDLERGQKGMNAINICLENKLKPEDTVKADPV